MVLDTSAIVAILRNEPEGPGFVRLLAADKVRLLSVVSRVECTCVIEGSKRAAGRADLERFLREAAIEIAPVTADQAEIACEVFRRYGKGRHPAGLNIGDTFAYALAKATGEPLLFKGADFAQTDITRAV
jgi:ribonuclease VapC